MRKVHCPAPLDLRRLLALASGSSASCFLVDRKGRYLRDPSGNPLLPLWVFPGGISVLPQSPSEAPPSTGTPSTTLTACSASNWFLFCCGPPKSTSSATRADAAVDAREGSVTTVARKRATVGLAARRESDSGSARAGREDARGDGNGTRRGAVEGRSAIWCVPGTAGGRGRLVRRLVQAGRAGDAGRDAGARRSARPPVGPV
ncbi:unnamed protein product [Closterium sp. NIES-53]